MINKTTLEYSKSIEATYGNLKAIFGDYVIFDYISDRIAKSDISLKEVGVMVKLLHEIVKQFNLVKEHSDTEFKKYISKLIRKDLEVKVDKSILSEQIKSRVKNYINIIHKSIL